MAGDDSETLTAFKAANSSLERDSGVDFGMP
jgi:hypothetical protein